MASSTVAPARQVRVFRQASEITKEVWDALLKNEAPANVILPYAKKSVGKPCSEDSKPLWIAVYDDAGRVELVLSCTKGPIGKNYPIFVVYCKSSERRNKSVTEASQSLVRRLLEEVPPQRVFSVFSTASVAENFAEQFVAQVPKEYNIQRHKDAYYDATFTFCTPDTLKKSSEAVTPFPEDADIFLRHAEMKDLKALAILDLEFSKTSPPYELDEAGAELEAKTMIENRDVWVHVIRKDGQAEEIACLVATTRVSDSVTTVTKVFTAEKWRSRGCAARLLHRVCGEEFSEKKKKQVVLFVGNSKELEPARKVYQRVGFQGLAPGQQVKDVERWLEIGFTNTSLGYW